MQSIVISSKNKVSLDQEVNKIIKDLEISKFDVTEIDNTNSESKGIGIEEIRIVQKKIWLKPIQSKTKALIVKEAENLTNEAQNALLKVLEEPPEDTVIILTTENFNLLLPTIISRCKIIDLKNNLDNSLEKEEDFSDFIEIAFSSNIGQKLKLSEEFGKSRDNSLEFLEKMIIFVRQRLINVINNNSYDLSISEFLNFLISMNKTYFVIKTTNVNQRFCLENLFSHSKNDRILEMNKKILITGSLAFDYIMDFPESFEENIIPEKIKTLSVSFLVQNYSKNFGGVAGNIGYNLALLGKIPYILSSAGKKDFETYNKHLKKTGADTSLINKVPNEFTANMFMITDKNNCQIAGFYPGAMSSDKNLLIKSKVFDLMVVAPTVPEAMNNFVNQTKRLNIPYLYDPAQQIPRIPKEELIEGLNGAEILIGNDYELALISKKTGIDKKQILKNAKIVITTLGEKGSLIETDEKSINVDVVKPKKIVDPTGAGDAYIAGFLSGYINDFDLKICGQIGATAATYAIEHYGTQNHKFTIEQFKKRYQQTFKIPLVF